MKRFLSILAFVFSLSASAQFGGEGFFSSNANVLIMAYDADAQANFLRLAAAGYAPSDAVKTAINNAVVDLKINNLYLKTTEMWLFIGATAATHAIAFKSPANDITFFGSITHSTTGALPDGTTGVGLTGLNVSTLTLYNTHIAYYSGTSSTATRSLVGTTGGTTATFRLSGNNTTVNSTQYNTNSSGNISGAPSNTTGFFIGSRTSATDHRLYKNGTQIGTTQITASGTLPNLQFAVMGVTSGSNGTFAYDLRQVRFASVGEGLTPSETAIYSTIINTLQTALSRNTY